MMHAKMPIDLGRIFLGEALNRFGITVEGVIERLIRPRKFRSCDGIKSDHGNFVRSSQVDGGGIRTHDHSGAGKYDPQLVERSFTREIERARALRAKGNGGGAFFG